MTFTQSRIVEKISLWPVLVMLALAGLILHAHLGARLDFDGENATSESVNFYGLDQVRNGRSPYHDFAVPPYVFSPYMPAFYWLPGAIARGLELNRFQTFILGRMIVYLAWLGVTVVLFGLARQAGSPRGLALLAALLWLAGELAPGFAVSYRPDAIVLFSALCAVWVYQSSSRPAGLVVVGMLLLLALAQKQTAGAALVAILWEECAQRRFRRAVILGGTLALTMAGVVAWEQWQTGGVFLKNVSGWAKLFVIWQQPIQILGAVVVLNAVPFLSGALVVAGAPLPAKATLLKRYFAVALVLGFVATTNPGTLQNHYLEALAIGCVLAALLASSVVDDDQPAVWRWLRLGWLGMLLATTLLLVVSRGRKLSLWLPEIITHQTVRQQEAIAWEHVLNRVAQAGEPVLVEDPYLEIRRGPTPYLLDAGALEVMRQLGCFDDSTIYQQISNGQFRVIVVTAPLDTHPPWRYFPESWRKLISLRYVLDGTCRLEHRSRTFYLYRPAE